MADRQERNPHAQRKTKLHRIRLRDFIDVGYDCTISERTENQRSRSRHLKILCSRPRKIAGVFRAGRYHLSRHHCCLAEENAAGRVRQQHHQCAYFRGQRAAALFASRRPGRRSAGLGALPYPGDHARRVHTPAADRPPDGQRARTYWSSCWPTPTCSCATCRP